jgi:hypothetical protein
VYKNNRHFLSDLQIAENAQRSVEFPTILRADFKKKMSVILAPLYNKQNDFGLA